MPRRRSKRTGPLVIGVMADLRGGRSRRRSQPFGEQSAYFRRLCRIAHEKGITLYVFSPTDVLWGKRRVWGYVSPAERFHPKCWKRRLYRFPQYIYDRHAPERPSARLFGERAARRFRRVYGIPCFNTRVGDKWRVHRRLKRHRELAPHLPATARFRKWSQVPAWLSRYPILYLKPAFARHGRGIARIRRRRGGGYHVDFHLTRSAQRSFDAATLPALAARCRRYMRKRRYLVQKGIRPATRSGRPLSIRVLTLNGRDGWEVSGIAARLGRAGAVVDNLHAGGHRVDPKSVLAEHIGQLGGDVEPVTREIRALALKVSSALDARPGHLAELGIDLLIDRSGKVWFLEANPRPGRTLFRHAGDGNAWDQVNRAPIEYARKLADRKAPGGAPAAEPAIPSPSMNSALTEVNI